MANFDDIFSAVRRVGAPATIGLIAALSASFLIEWLFHTRSLIFFLAFFTPLKFWTLLTYPFANPPGEFLWFILLLWWIFWVGSDVERTLGAKKFLLFFFGSAAIGAVSVFLGKLIVHSTTPLVGTLLPVSAVTVAWAMRNKGSQVRLMMILPVTGNILALISAGIVLFDVGSENPIIGFFALAPLVFAYFFAENKIPILPFTQGSSSKSKQTKQSLLKEKDYFDRVRKLETEREEKERLRKLFERSMMDDKE